VRSGYTDSMSLPRFQGRVSLLAWLLIAFIAVTSAHAQTQSVPVAPVPVPAPASSLPSMPTPIPVKNLGDQPQPSAPAPQNPSVTTPLVPVPAPPAPASAPVPSSPSPALTVPAPTSTAPAPDQPFAVPAAASSEAPAAQLPVEVAMPAPAAVASLPSIEAYDFLTPPKQKQFIDALGSTYIPVDSPVYPMALRLYSMGYLDSAFISMRPWTRRSLLHMLEKSTPEIMADGNDQATEILAKLNAELAAEVPGGNFTRGRVYGLETAYTRFLGISGQSLRDSFHLGQTIVNDYGRPYEPGFNNITGFSSVNEMGRFSLYLRGEYQHAPSGAGYSTALTGELSCIDEIPYPDSGCSNNNNLTLADFNLNQATIPTGPIAAQNPFRLQEAALSFHVLGHEISGGKSDAWLGPGMGGAMAWSNNAENIYSFRINRVEPLHIPLVSDLLGPIRYDFFVGSLKGHTDHNSPWVHSEMFSFRPTKNVEIGFQRSVIWGGEGHEPVNIHTFLRSFFSISDTTVAEKNSAADPGARFSAFNFSWRLPYLRKYVTLYTDSESHDDVTPPSAPRRAAYRPGVYISQFPHMPKLDFRIEGVSTDTSTLRSLTGQFNYYEGQQPQGYTNKGFIMGDWIGREAKGGQAWLTYHLSGNEWVQLEYLNKKTPKDFIPGGTTQNQFKVDVVKRLPHDIELNAWLQYERWKAPVPLVLPGAPLYIVGPPQYLPGPQNDTAIAVQLTWHPRLHTEPNLAGR
jgi:hypothetical protein